MNCKKEIGAFIGIDWGQDEHEFHVASPQEPIVGRFEHNIDSIENWLKSMLKLAGGKTIAIAVEQKRGALFNALVDREKVVIYAVDPGMLRSYRKTVTKEAKTDQRDAAMLSRFLCERINDLQPCEMAGAPAVQIHETARLRRQAVDETTRLKLKLKSALNAYYPLILSVFPTLRNAAVELIKRWPTERQLKKADRKTIARSLADSGIKNPKQQEEIIAKIRAGKIYCRDEALAESHDLELRRLAKQILELKSDVEEYDQRLRQLLEKHPKSKLFSAIQGVGAVTAARLVAAFEYESNCKDAEELAARSGVVPVPSSTGKNNGKRNVHRFACNKFLKQTFTEFIDRLRVWNSWTKARYQQLRQQGTKHFAAIRKIARAWIRILFRVWQDNRAYDDEKYTANLLKRNPELKHFINP